METVRRKLLFFLIGAVMLCLVGCSGRMRVEDFRPYGFRVQAVIHRNGGQERVELCVCAPRNGQRQVSVEWLAPSHLAGLRVSVEGDRCVASLHGMETDGTLLRSAVGNWDEWLSVGALRGVATVDYRGREALYVPLQEQEGAFYMDREGRIPLGLVIGQEEWEFLSYERTDG